MEIEEIGIREIPDASINTTIVRTSSPQIPSNIGFPVIQMPGCVRARTLKNKNLVTNDPAGNFYVCDGNVPTLESMTVDWDGLSAVGPVKEDEPEIVAPIPKLKGKERKEVKKKDSKNDQQGNSDVGQQEFEVPTIDGKFIVDSLPCPRPGSIPPGGVSKYGRKVVLRYEKNGDLCETIYQDRALFDVINSYTPPPMAVLNTATIATVSVLGVGLVGKPLSDYLMKLVKPIAKTVTKKVLKILGKKQKLLSLAERRLEQRKGQKK